ncbi:hypothetical protein D854_gp02 [Streptomyces phage R4]|uniref:Uncharacterized protein n=1 Tax=Streptomyces phage R4 TaxID=10732 RepID=K4I2U2_9CAUD|nr:hypothetical protein D854_gp02 [Streptomyces phage R4]AFU62140.1 hypothetical protein R4_84 [Streptomyces phage R4]
MPHGSGVSDRRWAESRAQPSFPDGPETERTTRCGTTVRTEAQREGREVPVASKGPGERHYGLPKRPLGTARQYGSGARSIEAHGVTESPTRSA